MKVTWLLSAGALLVWPAAVAQPAPRDTTVIEPALGYAFEVPRGVIVKHMVDGHEAQIPGSFEVDDSGGGPLVMVRTFGPSMFRALLGDGPLPQPGDTLLAYAQEEALSTCFGGPPGDSIVSLHRYRSVQGAEVFEIFVKTYPEMAHDEEDLSSTAADTVDASPAEESGYVAGPICAVHLSRAGARLWVSISPWGCNERPPAEWREVARVARAISRTLRWLKPSTAPR